MTSVFQEFKISCLSNIIKGANAQSSDGHPWRNWQVTLVATEEGKEVKGKSSLILDHVEYILHPTFDSPRRILKKEPYLLQEKGWGEFDLRALLHFTGDLATPKIIVFDLNFAQSNYSVVEKIEFPNASAELVHLLSMKPPSPTNSMSHNGTPLKPTQRPTPRNSLSSTTSSPVKHTSSSTKQSSNHASLSANSSHTSPLKSAHAPRRSSTSSKEAPLSSKSVPANKAICSQDSSPSLSSDDTYSSLKTGMPKKPISAKKPSSTKKVPLSPEGEALSNRSSSVSSKSKLKYPTPRHSEYTRSYDSSSKSSVARKRDASPSDSEQRRATSKSTVSSPKSSRNIESVGPKSVRNVESPSSSKSSRSAEPSPSLKPIRNGDSPSNFKASRSIGVSSPLKHSLTIESSVASKSPRATESSKRSRSIDASPNVSKSTQNIETSSKSGRTSETSKLQSNIYSTQHSKNSITPHVSSKLHEAHAPNSLTPDYNNSTITNSNQSSRRISDIVRHPFDINHIHFIHSNEVNTEQQAIWDVPNINMSQLSWRLSILRGRDRAEMQELIVANETDDMQFFTENSGAVGFNLYSFSSQLIQALWDLTDDIRYVVEAENTRFYIPNTRTNPIRETFTEQTYFHESDLEYFTDEDTHSETSSVASSKPIEHRRRELDIRRDSESRTRYRNESSNTSDSPRRIYHREDVIRKRSRDDRDDSPRKKISREESNRKKK
ncbi:hypothetical protein BY458DRAFT_15715 [Sporodiniella umbellata]|nr:hypothetical protein BY458DRAFT_15715 [Sporodiniella umbellata]